MRTERFLFCLTALGVLALAGCDQAPSSDKIDGTWAWGTTMNCYGNENTISFAGPRIQVYVHGDLLLSVANAKTSEEQDQTGKPIMVVRYTLQGKDFEERYRLLDPNTLRPLQTEVEGKPQVSAAGQDKQLVRCPADSVAGDVNKGGSAAPAPAPAPAPAQ